MDQQNTNAQPMTPLEFITTTTGTELVMAGPLAQAYSEGLDQLYAKDTNPDGTAQDAPGEPAPAMESEALDTGMQQRAYIAAKRPLLDQANKAGMSLFYGVQKGHIEVKHVIDIVERLAQMSDRQRKRSAVVVDTYIRPLKGQAFQKEHCVALEDIAAAANTPMFIALSNVCSARGVPMYSSFEEFLEKHN